jgi:fatty-acyl-CoA synthase
MNEGLKEEAVRTDGSTAKAWLRALELTAPIANNPDRILPAVILEVAARMGDAPALLSDQESFTYRALAERTNQYARWALDQGLRKGDVVCLLMANRPEFMAIWLGITSAGAIVSLLNTNLAGPSLGHCIRAVSPKHIIVSAELTQRLTEALRTLHSRALISTSLATSASPWARASGPWSALTIWHSTFTRQAPPGCLRPRA